MTMTFRQQAEHVVDNGTVYEVYTVRGNSVAVHCPRCGERIDQPERRSDGYTYGGTALRLILIAMLEAHLSEEHA